VPGDVALVTWRAQGKEHTDVRIRAKSASVGDVWWGGNGWIGDASAKGARRLVVIDPEDREQVEALCRAEAAEYEVRLTALQPEEITAMQAALRSLIADPKPEEPLGLGAVVVEPDGKRWVRIESADSSEPWREKPWACGPVRCHWQGVDAVKVLSEGVQ
jgi:hypothetical protein